MLRTVFIGSKNEFDMMLVDWLARRTELVGVVWTRSTSWRDSWSGRLDFARARLRRYGWLKTIDEALFHLHYHSRQGRRDFLRLQRQVVDPYWARHGRSTWKGRAIRADDVNAPRVLAYLKKRRPDVALAMCVNNYFGKSLREIPRHGVFLWHEGITPEYKGLYSPFWAVHNLDFERIGYSVLRMNDTYDAGEVFVSGRASGINPHRDGPSYIGHKAIADSLPGVEQLLRALEAGTARPIERHDARSRYYTYPGISDLVRQRLRLLRRARMDGRRSEDDQPPTKDARRKTEDEGRRTKGHDGAIADAGRPVARDGRRKSGEARPETDERRWASERAAGGGVR